MSPKYIFALGTGALLLFIAVTYSSGPLIHAL